MDKKRRTLTRYTEELPVTKETECGSRWVNTATQGTISSARWAHDWNQMRARWHPDYFFRWNMLEYPMHWSGGGYYYPDHVVPISTNGEWKNGDSRTGDSISGSTDLSGERRNRRACTFFLIFLGVLLIAVAAIPVIIHFLVNSSDEPRSVLVGRVTSELTLVRINYTEQMGNKSSTEFKILTAEFELEISKLYGKDGTKDYYRTARVNYLTNGSVKVNYDMFFNLVNNAIPSNTKLRDILYSVDRDQFDTTLGVLGDLRFRIDTAKIIDSATVRYNMVDDTYHNLTTAPGLGIRNVTGTTVAVPIMETVTDTTVSVNITDTTVIVPSIDNITDTSVSADRIENVTAKTVSGSSFDNITDTTVSAARIENVIDTTTPDTKLLEPTTKTKRGIESITVTAKQESAITSEPMKTSTGEGLSTTNTVKLHKPTPTHTEDSEKMRIEHSTQSTLLTNANGIVSATTSFIESIPSGSGNTESVITTHDDRSVQMNTRTNKLYDTDTPNTRTVTPIVSLDPTTTTGGEITSVTNIDEPVTEQQFSGNTTEYIPVSTTPSVAARKFQGTASSETTKETLSTGDYTELYWFDKISTDTSLTTDETMTTRSPEDEIKSTNSAPLVTVLTTESTETTPNIGLNDVQNNAIHVTQPLKELSSISIVEDKHTDIPTFTDNTKSLSALPTVSSSTATISYAPTETSKDWSIEAAYNTTTNSVLDISISESTGFPQESTSSVMTKQPSLVTDELTTVVDSNIHLPASGNMFKVLSTTTPVYSTYINKLHDPNIQLSIDSSNNKGIDLTETVSVTDVKTTVFDTSTTNSMSEQETNKLMSTSNAILASTQGETMRSPSTTVAIDQNVPTSISVINSGPTTLPEEDTTTSANNRKDTLHSSLQSVDDMTTRNSGKATVISGTTESLTLPDDEYYYYYETSTVDRIGVTVQDAVTVKYGTTTQYSKKTNKSIGAHDVERPYRNVSTALEKTTSFSTNKANESKGFLPLQDHTRKSTTDKADEIQQYQTAETTTGIPITTWSSPATKDLRVHISSGITPIPPVQHHAATTQITRAMTSGIKSESVDITVETIHHPAYLQAATTMTDTIQETTFKNKIYSTKRTVAINGNQAVYTKNDFATETPTNIIWDSYSTPVYMKTEARGIDNQKEENPTIITTNSLGDTNMGETTPFSGQTIRNTNIIEDTTSEPHKQFIVNKTTTVSDAISTVSVDKKAINGKGDGDIFATTPIHITDDRVTILYDGFTASTPTVDQATANILSTDTTKETSTYKYNTTKDSASISSLPLMTTQVQENPTTWQPIPNYVTENEMDRSQSASSGHKGIWLTPSVISDIGAGTDISISTIGEFNQTKTPPPVIPDTGAGTDISTSTIGDMNQPNTSKSVTPALPLEEGNVYSSNTMNFTKVTYSPNINLGGGPVNMSTSISSSEKVASILPNIQSTSPMTGGPKYNSTTLLNTQTANQESLHSKSGDGITTSAPTTDLYYYDEILSTQSHPKTLPSRHHSNNGTTASQSNAATASTNIISRLTPWNVFFTPFPKWFTTTTERSSTKQLPILTSTNVPTKDNSSSEEASPIVNDNINASETVHTINSIFPERNPTRSIGSVMTDIPTTILYYDYDSSTPSSISTSNKATQDKQSTVAATGIPTKGVEMKNTTKASMIKVRHLHSNKSTSAVSENTSSMIDYGYYDYLTTDMIPTKTTKTTENPSEKSAKVTKTTETLDTIPSEITRTTETLDTIPTTKTKTTQTPGTIHIQITNTTGTPDIIPIQITKTTESIDTIPTTNTKATETPPLVPITITKTTETPPLVAISITKAKETPGTIPIQITKTTENPDTTPIQITKTTEIIDPTTSIKTTKTPDTIPTTITWTTETPDTITTTNTKTTETPDTIPTTNTKTTDTPPISRLTPWNVFFTPFPKWFITTTEGSSAKQLSILTSTNVPNITRTTETLDTIPNTITKTTETPPSVPISITKRTETLDTIPIQITKTTETPDTIPIQITKTTKTPDTIPIQITKTTETSDTIPTTIVKTTETPDTTPSQNTKTTETPDTIPIQITKTTKTPDTIPTTNTKTTETLDTIPTTITKTTETPDTIPTTNTQTTDTPPISRLTPWNVFFTPFPTWFTTTTEGSSAKQLSILTSTNVPNITRTTETLDKIPFTITKTTETPPSVPISITKTRETLDTIPIQITKTTETPDTIPIQITKTTKTPDTIPIQITKTTETPDTIPTTIVKTTETPDTTPSQNTKTTETPDTIPIQITKTTKTPDTIPTTNTKTTETLDTIPTTITKTTETPDTIPTTNTQTTDTLPISRLTPWNVFFTPFPKWFITTTEGSSAKQLSILTSTNVPNITRTPETLDTIPFTITKTTETPPLVPISITNTTEIPDTIPIQITKTTETPDTIPIQIIKTTTTPDTIPIQITKTTETPDTIPTTIVKTAETPDTTPIQITKTTETPDTIPIQITKTTKPPDTIPTTNTKTTETLDTIPTTITKTTETPDTIPTTNTKTTDTPPTSRLTPWNVFFTPFPKWFTTTTEGSSAKQLSILTRTNVPNITRTPETLDTIPTTNTKTTDTPPISRLTPWNVFFTPFPKWFITTTEGSSAKQLSILTSTNVPNITRTPETLDTIPTTNTKTTDTPPISRLTPWNAFFTPFPKWFITTTEGSSAKELSILTRTNVPNITRTTETPDTIPFTITKANKTPNIIPTKTTKSTETPDTIPIQITKTTERLNTMPLIIIKTTETPNTIATTITNSTETPDTIPTNISKTTEKPIELQTTYTHSTYQKTQVTMLPWEHSSQEMKTTTVPNDIIQNGDRRDIEGNVTLDFHFTTMPLDESTMHSEQNSKFAFSPVAPLTTSNPRSPISDGSSIFGSINLDAKPALTKADITGFNVLYFTPVAPVRTTTTTERTSTAHPLSNVNLHLEGNKSVLENRPKVSNLLEWMLYFTPFPTTTSSSKETATTQDLLSGIKQSASPNTDVTAGTKQESVAVSTNHVYDNYYTTDYPATSTILDVHSDLSVNLKHVTRDSNLKKLTTIGKIKNTTATKTPSTLHNQTKPATDTIHNALNDTFSSGSANMTINLLFNLNDTLKLESRNISTTTQRTSTAHPLSDVNLHIEGNKRVPENRPKVSNLLEWMLYFTPFPTTTSASKETATTQDLLSGIKQSASPNTDVTAETKQESDAVATNHVYDNDYTTDYPATSTILDVHSDLSVNLKHVTRDSNLKKLTTIGKIINTTATVKSTTGFANTSSAQVTDSNMINKLSPTIGISTTRSTTTPNPFRTTVYYYDYLDYTASTEPSPTLPTVPNSQQATKTSSTDTTLLVANVTSTARKSFTVFAQPSKSPITATPLTELRRSSTTTLSHNRNSNISGHGRTLDFSRATENNTTNSIGSKTHTPFFDTNSSNKFPFGLDDLVPRDMQLNTSPVTRVPNSSDSFTRSEFSNSLPSKDDIFTNIGNQTKPATDTIHNALNDTFSSGSANMTINLLFNLNDTLKLEPRNISTDKRTTGVPNVFSGHEVPSKTHITPDISKIPTVMMSTTSPSFSTINGLGSPDLTNRFIFKINGLTPFRGLQKPTKKPTTISPFTTNLFGGTDSLSLWNVNNDPFVGSPWGRVKNIISSTNKPTKPETTSPITTTTTQKNGFKYLWSLGGNILGDLFGSGQAVKQPDNEWKEGHFSDLNSTFESPDYVASDIPNPNFKSVKETQIEPIETFHAFDPVDKQGGAFQGTSVITTEFPFTSGIAVKTSSASDFRTVGAPLVTGRPFESNGFNVISEPRIARISISSRHNNKYAAMTSRIPLAGFMFENPKVTQPDSSLTTVDTGSFGPSIIDSLCNVISGRVRHPTRTCDYVECATREIVTCPSGMCYDSTVGECEQSIWS